PAPQQQVEVASQPDVPPRTLRLVLGRSASGARYLLAASLWPTLSCAADGNAVRAPIDAAGAADANGVDANASSAADGQAPSAAGDAAAEAGLIDARPPTVLRSNDAGLPALDPGYAFTPRPRSDPGCWNSSFTEIVFAELPPEGVPAEIHQICMQPATELVQTGWAARLLLEPDATVSTRARGWVEIAPNLAERVLGVPEVRLASNDFIGLSASTPTPSGAGRFELGVTWQGTTNRGFDSWRHLAASVRFEVACVPPEPSARRSVEARSDLYLCRESVATRWISSGEACTTCAIIAEMAPSPIVPMPRASELPLEQVLRLNVRTIAAVGHDLLVYAEHDGGADDAEYTWHPSAGELEELAKDVVLWRLPLGAEPQLLQVVVEARSAVAVASVRFQGGVA
ncbi:MAG TPA: hypothetical protein VJU61_13640, partial [Polyangiaceae bacterium]|nr:hypothetical protein [Polyangiaceae bacterium]